MNIIQQTVIQTTSSRKLQNGKERGQANSNVIALTKNKMIRLRRTYLVDDEKLVLQ